jgi:uncharacterized protein YjiS (DUF1127 family)
MSHNANGDRDEEANTHGTAPSRALHDLGHLCLSAFMAFANAMRRRRARARSRAELEGLSDHALRDIGLSRCDIDFLVSQARRKVDKFGRGTGHFDRR